MLVRLPQVLINCLRSNAKASPLSLIVRSEMLMIIKLRTQDGLTTNGPSVERRSPRLKSQAVILTHILQVQLPLCHHHFHLLEGFTYELKTSLPTLLLMQL